MEHSFNHRSASLSDKITVLGNLEHVRFHALKSAGVKVDDPELESFFQLVAAEAQSMRRDFQRKHFPECPDELWCLGKAIETVRQRAYECDEGDSEFIRRVDNLWSEIWSLISGEDLSGCKSCEEDKGKIKDEDWDEVQGRLFNDEK